MKTINLVRAIVKNRDGKYLLLKKARDGFLPENVGKWECAGGRAEEGESPDKCVLRELREETRLKAKTVRALPFLSMRTGEVDSRCYVYLIETSGRVKLSDEHSEYKWARARDVKNHELVRFASLLLEYFNNEKSYLR